ncbi:MAG TPA: ubiquinol-cytochrome c reductase cytochrome b subunit [Nocardioidaceae bacterium]|nr:ubiquinol-cytochrome c reductase cytochrome b subunit [Nocardioidaceae bacterium]
MSSQTPAAGGATAGGTTAGASTAEASTAGASNGTSSRPKVFDALSGPTAWVDDRVGLATLVKKNLRKVFPDHWSFLLGEIALYSFIILLLSGTFLAIFFKPSMAEIVYLGSYDRLYGVEMSEAYASTLDISFDIRGGLLMRQVHHWSAHLFLASMLVHMLRVFFTGAYRKPREINWLVGLALLQLGIIEGFAGYSLPDDLLSGTGVRIAEGLMRSIPVVGTYVSFFVFGGEFPGDDFIPRIYIAHVLLVPGILLALITLHMLLLVYHKHTQWPGPGRTNNNVVGYPLLPVYAAKAGGFFFIVFGVTVLMSAVFQINAVWNFGPYDPSQVTAGSQPDWYMGWLDGALRIMPAWEFSVLGQTFSMNVFLPGVALMGLLFGILAVYPFVEQWVTGDRRVHHLLERPRNAPTRTAFGVAGMTAYGLLWISGGNDIIAVEFGLDFYWITRILRVFIFLGPVIAFIVTRRICIGLQRKDAELVLHGWETGIITRSPDGKYSERHLPVSQTKAWELTNHDRPPVAALPEATDENGVAAPRAKVERVRARLLQFWSGHDHPKPTADELHEAHSHHDGEESAQLEQADQEFQGVNEIGLPKRH